MKNTAPQTTETGASDKRHLDPSDLAATVKADFLEGRDVRLIDYPSKQRASVIGIIAEASDQFPVTCRWVTLCESHLSGTRLRCKTYRIDGAFLREGGAI